MACVVNRKYMYEQSINRISLKKKRPRCYVKSPTAQDTFQPIPGLISCGDQEMVTAISCTECSQVAGLFMNSSSCGHVQHMVTAGSKCCLENEKRFGSLMYEYSLVPRPRPAFRCLYCKLLKIRPLRANALPPL